MCRLHKKGGESCVKWLIIFACLDMVTGIVKMLVLQEDFSFKKFCIGILKKYVYFVLLLIGKYIEDVYLIDGTFNTILIISASYEIISNVENVIKISPNMKRIVDFIKQIINKKGGNV